jgi:hypothetical protein
LIIFIPVRANNRWPHRSFPSALKKLHDGSQPEIRRRNQALSFPPPPINLRQPVTDGSKHARGARRVHRR